MAIQRRWILEYPDPKIYGRLAEAILQGGARRATKFISHKLVVKATRRGKIDNREKSVEILFTVGRPNYAERGFIKKCKTAGEPFPVKKIRLQRTKK